MRLFTFASLGAKTCLIRGQWGQGGATSLGQHACGPAEYTWPSAINSSRMDVSSSNVFRVTYRANPRGKTHGRASFFYLERKGALLSRHCARRRVLGFDRDRFRPVPVSTYSLVNRDNSISAAVVTRSRQIAVPETLIAPVGPLEASRRRKLVSKRFLTARLHPDLVNFGYLLSSLSRLRMSINTSSHVPEIIFTPAFHSRRLYRGFYFGTILIIRRHSGK